MNDTYTYSNKKCVKCFYPCLTCDSLLECLTCADTYIFNSTGYIIKNLIFCQRTGLCEKCTVNNCLNCSINKAQCITCAIGFWKESATLYKLLLNLLNFEKMYILYTRLL